MGGGDLNMKKSWHPLLLKNQERVWLEEKKALEEKKKLDQLRKEKEEERQLQELQRLQEEQTGKKRQEKLEWMYSTPATGSGQNANDLEDYLLGKKRVDKILIGDENDKVGAAHKNFIATQFANSARDTAAKIREDPLLAIKQQEQSAYQALLSNPLRLKQLQEKNGINPKKEKKKHHKDKGKHRPDYHSPSRERDSDRRPFSPSRDRFSHSRRSLSPYSRRSYSRSPPSRSHDDRESGRYHSSRRDRSRSRDSYRRREPPIDTRHPEDGIRTWPKSDESDDNNYTRENGPESSRHFYDNHHKRRRSSSPRRYDPPTKRTRMSPPPSAQRQSSSAISAADDRAARLAAMTSNATTMSAERQDRLKTLLEQEKLELEAEQRARERSRGMTGFLNQERKKVFGGGGLEDRLKRGRQGLVSEAE